MRRRGSEPRAPVRQGPQRQGPQRQGPQRHGTAAARTGSLDPRAIRDVALVRYDALKEMAGQLSFSIAMLNAAGDGIVLTSINGRSETRTYAKAISGGQGAQSLSPEEEQAVRSARLGQSLPAVPAQGAGLEDGVTFVRSGRAQERALADGAASWLAPSARLVAVRSCCLCWGDST